MALEPLPELRAYLVAAGVVRDPINAGPLPPLWLQPRLEAPAPWKADKPGDKPKVTDDADHVLSAFLSGGIAAAPLEFYWRDVLIDIWIRTRKAPQANPIAAALRRALIQNDEGSGPRANWVMNNLRVISCTEWRPFTPLGSDELGFTAQVAYHFQFYAEDLDDAGGGP